MPMSRSLIIAAALASLLIATLAVPVAAAKTKLEIINGIPGKKVDVCVNGVEVKSGLRYGKFVFRTTRTARATVKFYKPDPRRCGGKLLAKKTSGLDDATWVVTRRFPLKVVVFDNAHLATPIQPTGSLGNYGHAADLGAVQFAYDIFLPTPSPIDLSADTSLKGEAQDWGFGVPEPHVFATYVTQTGVEVATHLHWMKPQRRLEWILVGTNIANAKLVFIDRRATLAS